MKVFIEIMYSWTRTALLFIGLAILPFFLVSCGGSDNAGNDGVRNSTPSTPSVLQPAVEQLQGGFQSISSRVLNQPVSIQAVIDSVEGLNVTAEFTVSAYQLEYLTIDSSNALVKVSGLLAVPDKSSPSPIISFQHGTIFTNAAAPSFHLAVDADSPEITLASLGYIVFSPDYVGYGSSFGREHPYLQKQSSASVVLDMLQAGTAWLDINNIETNGQLFMTGYSQGGYVTMAALQALQENPRSGLLATGAVMGAGPYDLNIALDKLLLGINVPGDLQDFAIDLLLRTIIPSNAEVPFERTFLERFFDDDRQDDVHNWRPDIPIKLFHGEDDRTVPIESAESTFTTMRNLGADVELIRCTAKPSNHRNCILPYVNFVVDYFDGLRSDR